MTAQKKTIIGGAAGKRVLITGAAGGIGRALARVFAQEGCRLALLDLDGDGVKALARELKGEGIQAQGHGCDIRDFEACRAVTASVEKDLGGIDILVNNAGLTHRSLFSQTSLEVLKRIMEVNFFGAVHCTQAALPGLMANQGMIVVISSIAGVAPLIGRSGYSASKHALHGFFDTLRAELSGRGVGVLLVCPSYVDTPIDRNALDGKGSKAGSVKATIGGLARPEDVAAAIVKATLKREKRLVLTPVGKISYWLSKLAPDIYVRLMRASVKSEFPMD